MSKCDYCNREGMIYCYSTWPCLCNHHFDMHFHLWYHLDGKEWIELAMLVMVTEEQGGHN